MKEIHPDPWGLHDPIWQPRIFFIHGLIDGNHQLEQDLMGFWNPGGLGSGDLGFLHPKSERQKHWVFPEKTNESAQNKEVKSKFEITVDGSEIRRAPVEVDW